MTRSRRSPRSRSTGSTPLAHRILRDVDRTDDAVQECLIRAWRELPRLRDPDRFDAWLRRLLVNACYDESRRAASPFRGDPGAAPGACRRT